MREVACDSRIENYFFCNTDRTNECQKKAVWYIPYECRKTDVDQERRPSLGEDRMNRQVVMVVGPMGFFVDLGAFGDVAQKVQLDLNSATLFLNRSDGRPGRNT